MLTSSGGDFQHIFNRVASGWLKLCVSHVSFPFLGFRVIIPQLMFSSSCHGILWKEGAVYTSSNKRSSKVLKRPVDQYEGSPGCVRLERNIARCLWIRNDAIILHYERLNDNQLQDNKAILEKFCGINISDLSKEETFCTRQASW